MAIIQNKFFVNPFAVQGDKNAIPDAAQPDGSISYDQGYTFDYQVDPTSDPSGRDIERNQFNQLMYDMTLALRQYQVWGVPNFITTAQNLGSPYSYPKNAMALYNDGINGVRVYQSLQDNNTALPTDASKWQVVVHNNTGFSTGDVKLTLKQAADAGWVLANDGTIGNPSSGATTRANADTIGLFEFLWNTFSNAIAPVSGGRGASAAADFAANKTIQLLHIAGRALAVPGTAIVRETFTASTSTSELTISAAESFYTGTAVTLTTTGTLPAPLATATTYYLIDVDSTHIKLATSRANAIAGTAITLTTTGTGTHNVIITMPGRVLGSFTGEPTHTNTISETAAHNHTGSSASVPGSNNDSGDGYCEFQGNTGETAPVNLSIATQGGSNPHNNMQPSVFLNVMIKL